MILHIPRMRRNVNRNIYNAGEMYARQRTEDFDGMAELESDSRWQWGTEPG